MPSPDLAASFELYRFVLCVALALVGGLAVFLGYVLFSRGAGLHKAIDKINVNRAELKISITGMSAGGALMLTSVAWGFWSYSAVPHLEVAGNTIQIGSLPRSGGLANVAEVSYPKLAGSEILSADKKKVGTLSGVLIDKNSIAKAFAVDIANAAGKKTRILLNAKDFRLNVTGAHPMQLTTTYNKDQIDDMAVKLQPHT